jgi:RNA polymerase sigma-70 factor (ECF subfamily)
MISVRKDMDLSISNQGDNPLTWYRAAKITGNQVAVNRCADTLVQTYSPNIYRQGLQIWYGRPQRFDLADELTQITLIKVCSCAESYHPGMNPRTWIYSIAMNSARDMFRAANAIKRQAKSTPNDAGDGQFSLDWLSDTHEQTPINRVSSVEIVEAVREEISKLPPLQRVVMELIAQDTGLIEIAEILEIPHGTVKSRSHTARIRLKASLEERGIIVKKRSDSKRELAFELS